MCFVCLVSQKRFGIGFPTFDLLAEQSKLGLFGFVFFLELRVCVVLSVSAFQCMQLCTKLATFLRCPLRCQAFSTLVVSFSELWL